MYPRRANPKVLRPDLKGLGTFILLSDLPLLGFDMVLHTVCQSERVSTCFSVCSKISKNRKCGFNERLTI